jgi:RNase P/RNase MRP subunit p30
MKDLLYVLPRGSYGNQASLVNHKVDTITFVICSKGWALARVAGETR